MSLQTFDLPTTVHAVTALEPALLDLHGQAPGGPVAELRGRRPAAHAVPMLGSPFFVGDPSAPTRPTVVGETAATTGSRCAARRR